MDSYWYRVKYAGYWCAGYCMRGMDLAGQVWSSFRGYDQMKLSRALQAKSALNPINWFEYVTSTDSWIENTSIALESNHKVPTLTNGLTVATLNVLTNDVQLMDEVVCTPQRFRYTCETILNQVDADVICLNEVSASFVPILLSQDWVRQRFVSSCRDASHCHPRGSIQHYDNISPKSHMILCKKELAFKLWIEDTVGESVRDRPSFVAQIDLKLSDDAPKSTIYITSVHFTAYEQYPKIRKAEIDRLISALKATCQKDSAIVILGDFNFHAEEETASIPEDFYDVWLRLKGLKTEVSDGSESSTDIKDLAYTYDPNYNTMISRVYPPERRRMRLDRVIMNHTSDKIIKPISISKFADEPIPTSAGVREGTFASDHYGLRIVLQKP